MSAQAASPLYGTCFVSLDVTSATMSDVGVASPPLEETSCPQTIAEGKRAFKTT